MATRLVGRDVELAALTKALDAAEAGQGRVVLLSGDAGIGKSRLAAQVLAEAEARGFAVLRGQAHALHVGLAYAPIVEAVRRHLATAPDPGWLLEGLADLGRLLADPRLPAVPPVGDPGLERTRMFEAVTRLVRRIAGRAPVLVFVDDLHWADRGTVELLHYLGRGVLDERVLVLTGYRPSETTSALAELAKAVRRATPDAEIELGPLTDEAVGELVAGLGGQAPTPELLRRAKGVPLFVTALAGATGPLPAIVRDVVLGRLHRLDEPERRLMELVAVLGDNGSAEVLRAAWEAGDFWLSLRALLADGLLIEQVGGQQVTYRVAHPLYAEVAYAELTVGERRRLHAELAVIIDRVLPGDVFALAPHIRDAGGLVDANRAIEVMTEAGKRALAVFAAEESTLYLGAALTRARETGRADLLPALLDWLGRAHQGAGDLEAAAVAWREGAKLAGPALRGELNHRLSMLESERGNAAAAHEYARGGQPSSLETIILHLIFAIRHGDKAEVATMLGRLRAATEHDESDAAKAALHYGRMLEATFADDFATAREETLRSLEYAERVEAESPIHVQGAHRLLVGLSMLAGDLPAAVEHAKEHSTRLGPFEMPSGQCSGQYSLATAYYLAGALDEAMREIDVGVAIARRNGLARSLSRSLTCRALILAEQGRLTEAAACVAEGEGCYPTGDTGTTALADLARTVISLHSGRTAAAPPSVESRMRNEQLVVTLRLLLTGLAGLAAGDREAALRASAGLREDGATAPLLDALADRLDGLLQPSAELLELAADRLEAMGAKLLSAQARLEWAELAEDKTAAIACLEAFEQVSAAPWADRARRLARSLGVRVPAGRRVGTLSGREWQIVGLVGDGLSNADIAARLFLSERTVETHLRNSYAKLGLGSRVALARWAVEHGST
ncbi:ATP-binding protein [Amycolatopsis sp. NPDC059657]|uniref:ATP-binding protein n=1 Tax=Amycolatopsis sp. NPDC059657 TaxID=3346899 RepID=UPI00367161DE